MLKLALGSVMVVAMPWLMGCATIRTDYAPASAEPMRVHDQTVTKHGTETVATGQDQYTNKNGDVVATKTHYENRDVSWTEREWYAEQGGEPIDDESFFRIVKDEEAIQRYDEKRASGVTRNRLGIVGTIVGVLAVGGGAGAVVMAKDDDNKTLRTGGFVGIAAGTALCAVGILAIMDGRRDAEDKNLRLFDAARVKTDARRYDTEKLGLLPVGAAARPPVAAAPPPPAKSEMPKDAATTTTTSASPVRVVLSSAGRGGRVLEASPDGSVFADELRVGRMADDDSITDTKGKVVMRVTQDGTIFASGSKSIGRFDGDDVILLGRGRVTVERDGTIILREKRSGHERTLARTDSSANKRRALQLMFATTLLNDSSASDRHPPPSPSPSLRRHR